MAINSVSLTGNLTRDAELKTIQENFSAIEFSIAVNDRTRNQNGEWEDYPNYFNCVLYGKRAESLHPYLKKGLKLAVDGKLSQQRWRDANGENRSRIRVIVSELDFMAKKQTSQQPQQQPFTASAPAQENFSNTDLPF